MSWDILCFSSWPSTNFLMFWARLRTLLGRFQGSCLMWSLNLFGQLSFGSISCWNSNRHKKSLLILNHLPNGYQDCKLQDFLVCLAVVLNYNHGSNFFSYITGENVLNTESQTIILFSYNCLNKGANLDEKWYFKHPKLDVGKWKV